MTGPHDFNPAIARSFLYIQPGDPYSPQALEDARNTIRQIPAVGGVRITEGKSLDAYGRLPYTVDVEDRLPYAIGASAKYSTTNGPAGQVYWEDRNVFGGAERLRLQADVFYAPPWYITSQDISSFSIHDLGWRFSASFLKPALWGTPNDLLVDALDERVSTSGAGFFGYEVEDADATVALRHRFGQNFWVQAGIQAQTGVATDFLGQVNYTLVGVPVSANYDTTDSKLDPTRGVRFNASVAGFPTALGSSVDLVQGKRAPQPTIRSIRTRASCLRASSGSAPWAARTSPTSRRTGASTPAAAARCAAMPLTASGRPVLSAAVIGGRSLFEVSAELRVRVTDTIGIVPFFDAGNAFTTSFPNFSAPLAKAAGIGLRYYTAIGPIRADVAFPLNPRPGRPAGGALCQHRAGFLMMRRLLPQFRLMALLVALVALGSQARATEEDKGMLANLLSRALSSETTSVSIGAVDGVLSSDASISDIVLSDRNGPWLKIDKVRLIWNRLALFSRRLEVDRTHHRTHAGPASPACRPETPRRRTRGPRSILPELPVKVIVKQFALQELSLGEPVAGVAARARDRRQGDARAALRGPRPDARREAARRGGRIQGADDLCPGQRQAHARSSIPTSRRAASSPISPTFPACRRSSSALTAQGTLDNFDAKLDFAAGAGRLGAAAM